MFEVPTGRAPVPNENSVRVQDEQLLRQVDRQADPVAWFPKPASVLGTE